jgi:flagellar motor protein MotB
LPTAHAAAGIARAVGAGCEPIDADSKGVESMLPRSSLGLSALVTAAACCGCGTVSQGKYSACQSQNRMLTEQTKAQLAEIENLKIHSRHVEDQLIHAEQELARLDGGRQRVGRNAVPAGLGTRLSELARRYPSLQYDPATGISKFDTDLLFDSGDAALKPQGDQILAEFADIFRSPEARELKIMVVGHADAQGIKGRELRERYPNNWHLSAGRALAVADQLRKAGIPESRMGVAGFGQYQPVSSNDTDESRQLNRRVEIFVLGPETPVVGWVDATPRLYR